MLAESHTLFRTKHCTRGLPDLHKPHLPVLAQNSLGQQKIALRQTPQTPQTPVPEGAQNVKRRREWTCLIKLVDEENPAWGGTLIKLYEAENGVGRI